MCVIDVHTASWQFGKVVVVGCLGGSITRETFVFPNEKSFYCDYISRCIKRLMYSACNLD